MSRDRVMRSTLWTTAVLNAIGTVMYAAPALGFDTGLLPIPIPPFYGAQLAVFIGLFGGAYAWLATSRIIDRPMVTLGMIGKAMYFAVGLLFWATGNSGIDVALKGVPDLIIAAIFGWWLNGTRPMATAEFRATTAESVSHSIKASKKP